jgi:hypothetical protein
MDDPWTSNLLIICSDARKGDFFSLSCLRAFLSHLRFLSQMLCGRLYSFLHVLIQGVLRETIIILEGGSMDYSE